MRGGVIWLLLGAAWSASGQSYRGDDVDFHGAHSIEVQWPVPGSVHSGGVVHFNYTISSCPPNSYIVFMLNEVRVGGDDAFFVCTPFMWHGMTDMPAGTHVVFFTLYVLGSQEALAHASTTFDVTPSHGRFFGVSKVALVDGAPTGAYIRAPRNHSVHSLATSPTVLFEAVAANFVPGKNGLNLRLYWGADAFDLDADHRAELPLPLGSHCVSAAVVSEDGVVGVEDTVCVRVVDERTAPTCDSIQRLLDGPHMQAGLVIDTAGCETAALVAERCGGCGVVLCAPWDTEQAPADGEVNLTATADDYRRHFDHKVRRVVLEAVPGLQRGSLDFVLIRHYRVESAVDQKAELESTVGMVWHLLRGGGVAGVLSDANQIIIIKDADGNLWQDYADYTNALQQTSQLQDGTTVQAIKCPGIPGAAAQAVYAMRTPAPIRPEHGLYRDGDDAPGFKIQGLGHIYVVHFAPLKDRRKYLENLFFERWGLEKDYVTFVTWCDSRKTTQQTIDKYYKPSVECIFLRGNRTNPTLADPSSAPKDAAELSRKLLGIEFGKAQACTAISHYDSLLNMLDNGHETALILEDDAVFDEDFPALLGEYLEHVEPDWGVLFTDAATSCHWWTNCEDLQPRRPVPTLYRRWIPGGSFGGAILWHQRGARALASTFAPFCIPWDMEIEYHFKVHNLSVSFASPALITQGTFLNPGEKGYTKSSLLGERNPERDDASRPHVVAGAKVAAGAAPAAGAGAGALGHQGGAGKKRAEGAGDGGGASGCADFSFFDCHASRPWAACVAQRDRCEAASAAAG